MPDITAGIAVVTLGVNVAESIVKGIAHLIGAAQKQSAKMTGNIINDVNSMKDEYGNGISSLITIYNQTGTRLVLSDNHSHHGHIWKYPYPPIIDAGANGGFLHVHNTAAVRGSEAWVLYKIEYVADKKGEEWKDSGLSVKFGWKTPYNHRNEMPEKWNEITGEAVKGAPAKGTFELVKSVGENSSPLYEFVLIQKVK